ncbi:MAG: TonB-dependent receptor [Candidatus Pseudobacter hemicellulosilyticus]|uniref:TonB-dependent receptor n=1 Tax=Candidatus Pseudobacter hemicellulosilyticus TaxID=3121375 RepID=A0AAJ6BDC6_9BACT|nr:MAG: TonB-dependent receptor [Pseudobacter sp.]
MELRRMVCLLLIIAGWTGNIAAQQANTSFVVTGIIRDSISARSIAYATISILDSASNTIASTYSLENGSFKTALPRTGTYHFEISSVGFSTITLTRTIHRFPADLGILLLQPGEEQLQAVSVTARRRLVQQKPGMLVYNAEMDITNKGGTAADVLRKAPILSVDAQGNVSMRGSSNLKILINGKYSGQMARSAADALNMMPADMIKSIEIITTPSARYDAEGAAGVINIITRKGNSDLSGTLEASASNLEQVFNPRLSYSNEKWHIHFAGHLHRLRQRSANSIDRTTLINGAATNRLRQNIERDNAAPHGSADLAIDYTLNASSELSLGVNAWMGNWPHDSRTSAILRLPNDQVAEQYFQDIDNRNNYLGADINLGYTKRFKKTAQQLTLLVQGSPSRDLSDYDARQTSTGKELLYREINNSHTRNREWTAQADYTHPLNTKGSVLLETGGKLIFRNVGNRYDVSASDPADVNQLNPQADRSDHFKYSQDVMAGYAMLRLNLPDNWFFEGGSRLEATAIKGNMLVSGTAFNNHFLNLVPTATLSKKLGEGHTLTISYTKRLTRPYIWDLNPNADASDPKNIESGNPELQPEISHQAELAYGLNSGRSFFLNTALFWKQTDNAIIEFMETNAEGVSLTSKQNLAGNKQFGLNSSATANLSEKWTANGNLNIDYFDYSSTALTIFRSGWGATMNLNSTYKLPRRFSVQAFGEYTTRQVTLLGTLGRRYYYSFAGKKEISGSRMTITLAAVNLFSPYVEQTDDKLRPAFISSVANRYYNRAVKLTLSWEFGSSRKQQKERKKIDNSDINVQGKG